MRQCSRTLLFVAAVLLGACFTMAPYDVYMPQGDVELVDASCQSGPPVIRRIALPNQVELLVNAFPSDVYPTTYLQIALEMRLRVPAGTTARFTGADVALTSTAWPDARTLTIVHINDPDVRLTYAPLAELPGTGTSSGYNRYELSFNDSGPAFATAIPAVDNFSARLPTLLIDGHEASIPEITFEKQTLRGLRLACD